MGLRLKFNLVLVATFTVALAVSAFIAYDLLRPTPQDELVRSASLMMETAQAIRGYLDEVVGAQIVSVPMDRPIHNARRVFVTFMGSLIAVFASLFVILNVMLSTLIVRPISRMSRAAEQVSTGDFTVAEFSDRGGDEVARLGRAFNRMRRSLQKAMQLMERR